MSPAATDPSATDADGGTDQQGAGAGTSTAPVRVALVGTRGFGRVHLENLARLTAAGLAELVGVVDIAEPPAELAAIHHPSLEELLAAVPGEASPEVVIIATPIDTHVPLATAALAAGCHVYLEKPPVPELGELRTLQEAADAAGRSLQVGFQARGGGGVGALIDLIATGQLGAVRAVRAYGAWQRDRAYYQRSRWAGRRRLDGRRVADGVATNPLAHSVHAALAIAGMTRVEDVARVTTELRRAHDIEADDTSFLRVEPAPGGTGEPARPTVLAALTTTAPTQGAPWVEVLGENGSARLWYTEDRAEVTAADGTVTAREFPRRDLVENLLAHVRDPQVALISPLASTGAFSAVLEAIQSVPDPLPIDPSSVTWEGDGEAAHPVVDRIEEALLEALDRGVPFSRLGLPWAREDAIATWTPPAS
ncbi:Gfo/Idh/MocA family protein [Brachybacterium sp. J153]|uniref:Gfo/Idh/MocA family protein n=1 Tax=Brachybacterium sp. J153 TaxID=3116488 RepID=UPI002E763E84|nr:Gfo/Idh/MocA family oxidoreductase [Brachybacterium sp. J153]MEE1617675.1 Gfo/Idh/MocA family oxidoreductase [Brachybacterium sp. J153]